MLPFNVRYDPSSIAIITDDGQEITYGGIEDCAVAFSRVIEHRCLVFCLTKNTPGSVMGYLSFVANRIVPAMLDSKMDKHALAELVRRYKPQYIWLPNERSQEYRHCEIAFAQHAYSLVKLDTKNCFPLHDNLALLLTTSGSTGSPKFVRISYEAIEGNAAAIASYLSLDEKERPITTLPMNYSFGLSVINSHVLTGATLLLTSKTLMERSFWDFLKNQKATSLSGVPYTFEVLSKLRFTNMNLPSLKTLTQAGGKMNLEVNKAIAEFCDRTGKQFFGMYGQTEATARISYLPPEYALEKLGSIGIPVPGGALSLIDEKGAPIVENDIVGELVYQGINVSMGYAIGGEDLKKEDQNQGRLLTGDLACRDTDGFYFIKGRKKRIIKIHGRRINLDELNCLLNTVTECACAGKDDHLIVYTTNQTKIAEIEELISRQLRIHPQAYTVRYSTAIPQNPVGKVNFHQLENP